MLPSSPTVAPERRQQECTGCPVVLGIIVALVALVHANASADGLGAFARLHTVLLSCIDCLAILALFLLLLVMRGPRDLVVRRLRENVEPLPQPVAAKLARGESLDGLSNPVDGDTSFCVRCCVWRRPASAELCGAPRLCQPSRRVHHCRSCGACVLMFDHHCGFFGRCIAGSLWRGGGNMRAFVAIICTGYAAGGVTLVSLAVRIFFDAEGRLLHGWPRRAAALLFLSWSVPMAVGLVCQAACMAGHWVAAQCARWRDRRAGGARCAPRGSNPSQLAMASGALALV